MDSPSVLGTLNELGTHATFFTTPGLLSLSLALSVCLLISLHGLTNPLPLSLSFFFLSLPSKLPYSSLDKNVDESPLEKKKKKTPTR